MKPVAHAVSLADLRCACGSTEVMAVAPGDEPEIAPGGIVVAHGRPVTGRCLQCFLGRPREVAPPRLRCCYACAGTAADGTTFATPRKPVGKPDLCADCTGSPFPTGPRLAGPVFAAGTHRAAFRRRLAQAQTDLVDLARGRP